MKGKSGLSNLIFFDKVTLLVGEEKAVDVILLYFSKAFDTVPHNILLDQLWSKKPKAVQVNVTWWDISIGPEGSGRYSC